MPIWRKSFSIFAAIPGTRGSRRRMRIIGGFGLSESARASGESPDAARETRALPGTEARHAISGAFAFRLYDDQGFPLDLTELMARERGLTVDIAGFEKLMEEQQARARAAQKKEVDQRRSRQPAVARPICRLRLSRNGGSARSGSSGGPRTRRRARSAACYAEMGGQVGDTGCSRSPARPHEVGASVNNTQKTGNTWVHFAELDEARAARTGSTRCACR